MTPIRCLLFGHDRTDSHNGPDFTYKLCHRCGDRELVAGKTVYQRRQEAFETVDSAMKWARREKRNGRDVPDGMVDGLSRAAGELYRIKDEGRP